uniref:DUF3782 domain-containing protein n=1 Tax=Candidatus Kentrum sp. FW TaxID=2126338 RepID=A0A450TRZ5_9GAMM|nr:MAG: hypothetical protein BECKFW1821B_GA0114236_12101 [Candidatus Kentron sp. FW]
MSAITYEEVLSLFKMQAEEAERRGREIDRLFRETDRKMQETDRKMQETDRKMQETNRKMQETAEQIKETDRIVRETAQQMKETDHKLKELGRITREQGKQIGGLGDKFGYFTEGLALSSMERILAEQFGMTASLPRARIRKNGEEIEIDVLAYANDDINLAILVEVKSRVKREAISQLQKLMGRFREFCPEHRDKAAMGILAGVDWDRGIAEEARKTGFLTASIRDEIFTLTTPEGFEARRW